jgi:hypothetical protein
VVRGAVLLFLFVAVVAWGSQNDMWLSKQPLGPLRDDPMAAEDLLGLELLDALEDDGVDTGNWMDGKGRNTVQIARYFALPETGWQELIKQIAAHAEENGWERVNTRVDLERSGWDAVFSYDDPRLEFTKPNSYRAMYLYVLWIPDDIQQGVSLFLRWS